MPLPFLRLPFVSACAFLPILVCAGCAPLHRDPPLLAGLRLTSLTVCDAASPAAWAPDGRRIAFGRDGVVVRQLADGFETRLDKAVPRQLCWLDDERLAVAVEAGERTRLFLLQAGEPPRQVELPGRLDGLARGADGALLAVTTRLQRFYFGANLSSRLYRWDGAAPPSERLLNDVSLKPLTVRQWGERLFDQLQPDFSPLGDIVVFSRLHDPPAFSPYLQLVQLHLGGGEPVVLGRLPIGSRGARWLDDERLLLADASNAGRVIAPWGAAARKGWPRVDAPVAVAADGGHLFASSTLYAGEKAVAQLDGIAAA